MRILFLGANRQVTGSKHLLQAEGLNVLVDCGLFQERPYLDRNWEPFPIAPDSVGAILLTHAHLDHCGYIPRLVATGFGGRILATAATIELAEIVLLDAANIQEEDAAYKKKRHAREGRRGPHPEIPLYTAEDAARAVSLFEPVRYGVPFRLTDRITAEFHDAGHILGSSMLSLDVLQGRRRRIIFSGDVGPWDRPLIHDPSLFSAADDIILEATYGDREHDDGGRVEDILATIVLETAARGGNLVIPVFALERAQELMFYLGLLVRGGRIPRLPVYLDSPMAAEVTQVFARHPDLLDPEAQALVRSQPTPFAFPGFRLVRTIEESKAINALKTPCVILAGSGMCTAGRIKHHLVHNIDRPDSTILFVGYQAAATLGRQILDREPRVRINGRWFDVKARVAQITGLSGHAGRHDLLRWLQAFTGRPEHLFLTHSDENVGLDFARSLEGDGWPVNVPHYLESFELG